MHAQRGFWRRTVAQEGVSGQAVVGVCWVSGTRGVLSVSHPAGARFEAPLESEIIDLDLSSLFRYQTLMENFLAGQEPIET